MHIITLLAATAALSACASRYGEIHAPPALVTLKSAGAPLNFWLISVEESASIGGNTLSPIEVGKLPEFDALLQKKAIYITSENRHRLKPGRVVAVVRCSNVYRRMLLDLKGTTTVQLGCESAT